MKRALISVSDKTKIVDFALELTKMGYEIISTGGTKKVLDKAGVNTIGISEITNFPEILGGRVKTLDPHVHGGLLAVRDNVEHQKEVKENKIEYIDMVVVNLYPFKETVQKGASFEEAIENIDIGGPSMLRSAAKNHKFVTVVCDVNDYDLVLKEIKENKDTLLETRNKLAAKVFSHTAAYDTIISNYLNEQAGILNPKELSFTYSLVQELRYGENPHQKAAFYASKDTGYSLAYGNQLHGKALSYNNIQDANAALDIVKEFTETVLVASKHMNPCGVGIGKDINEAWDKAYASDKVSIFGGIIATNREVTAEVAKKMNKIFLEIVIAPSFSYEAMAILSKKKNIRLMTVDMNVKAVEKKIAYINGGIILQDIDTAVYNELTVVTKKQPTKEEMNDLIFGYKVCKHVKSNAILLVKDLMTAGVGAGQMNRVGAALIALEQAKANNHQSFVLASDAFFPFDDTIKLAAKYGVTAIIQPGGSINDADSIKACDELGIAMVCTKMRHFKH